MPALSFFADADDVGRLVEHLNGDPDLAFLVPLDGLGLLDLTELLRGLPPNSCGGIQSRTEQRRWKAVRTVPSLADGWHTLWHTPTPERLFSAPGRSIADPWNGWCGSTIVDVRRAVPDVGSGPEHHGIIYLDLMTRHRPCSAEERAAGGVLAAYWPGPDEMLHNSYFSWTGGYYRPAPKETTRWWNGLKRWMGRTCAKLTDAQTGRQTFYAFPSALDRLQSGIKYRANNWDLDASIKAARLP